MTQLENYFQDYAAYHQTSGNQRTHTLGIPLIVIAVLGLASRWAWIRSTSTELPSSLFQLDFGILLLLLASLWYVYLDWKWACAFFPVLLACYWVGRCLSVPLGVAFFVVGWIFQLVGHGVYEKKSPAFTKNLEHLLIGPIWVFVKLLGFD